MLREEWGRSRLQCSLRHSSAAARMLRSRFRIHLRIWVFVSWFVACCLVISVRSLSAWVIATSIRQIFVKFQMWNYYWNLSMHSGFGETRIKITDDLYENRLAFRFSPWLVLAVETDCVLCVVRAEAEDEVDHSNIKKFGHDRYLTVAEVWIITDFKSVVKVRGPHIFSRVKRRSTRFRSSPS
jgi:hypothetical protein